MRSPRSRTAVLLVLMAIAPPARAGDVPFLAGHVNDTAGMLSHENVTSLESLLRTHEDSTSNQVVILTIPSLGGESIEEYALRVAETWKLGQKGKDNGVLLLVAREEKKVRIEVGSGLEGDLPDITCGTIIRHDIVPRFRDGDFDAGVRDGTGAILAAIAGTYTSADEDEPADQLGLLPRLLGLLIFFAVVGMFTALGILTRGCQAWFLYVFLIPFWASFPSVLIGLVPGIALLGLYLLGFPLAKLWLSKSSTGKGLAKKWISARSPGGVPLFGGSSSGSGWSSGSSGGFSGGGGGFSGGGASGGW